MAEARIAAVLPAVGDCLLSYRMRYPKDAYLRLWSGLLFANRKRYALATAEFKQSIEQGCDHWRAYWYLSRAARSAGSIGLAENALAVVRKAAPQFTTAMNQFPALEMVELTPDWMNGLSS